MRGATIATARFPVPQMHGTPSRRPWSRGKHLSDKALGSKNRRRGQISCRGWLGISYLRPWERIVDPQCGYHSGGSRAPQESRCAKTRGPRLAPRRKYTPRPVPLAIQVLPIMPREGLRTVLSAQR